MSPCGATTTTATTATAKSINVSFVSVLRCRNGFVPESKACILLSFNQFPVPVRGKIEERIKFLCPFFNLIFFLADSDTSTAPPSSSTCEKRGSPFNLIDLTPETKLISIADFSFFPDISENEIGTSQLTYTAWVILLKSTFARNLPLSLPPQQYQRNFILINFCRFCFFFCPRFSPSFATLPLPHV